MFGDVIRERRLARGWSQAELATAVGVSAPYISMIETKKRGQEPGYDTLVRLAEVFSTTVEELRSAANRDAPFPTDELVAEGLDPGVAARIAREWETVAIKYRAGLLSKAHRLARLQAEVAQLQRSLGGEEGQHNGKPDIH